MDRDSGRGSRSNEPPKLADVRRLHVDHGEGSSATATEEWYETERLTGQITGRARSAPPIDPTPVRSPTGVPVVLDWRHEEVVPPPTALERLGRTLAARRDRRRRSEGEGADVRVTSQAGGVQRPLFPTTSQIAQPPLEPPKTEPAVDEIHGAPPSGPRIALREPADRAMRLPKRSAPSMNGRERAGRRGVFLSALVLSVVAVSGVGIASVLNSTAAKPRQTNLVGATSRLGTILSTAAKTVIGGLGILERQLPNSRVARRVVNTRRGARHETRDRPRPSKSRASVSRIESAAAAVGPTSMPSTTSYGSSSAAPAYSAQPATGAPALAVMRSAPQPAGPSGPGGTVGSNCNPKCS